MKQLKSDQAGRAALAEIKTADKIPDTTTAEHFMIIWWESMPQDADSVATMVPTLHPELVFSMQASHFIVPRERIVEIMQPLIHHPLVTQVAAQVAISARADAANSHTAHDAVADAIVAVTTNVAVMQIVDEHLRSTLEFDFVKGCDRLICQQIRQMSDGGVYALVLNQDINPAEYWFNTTNRLESVFAFYSHIQGQPINVHQTESPASEKTKNKWWKFWK